LALTGAANAGAALAVCAGAALAALAAATHLTLLRAAIHPAAIVLAAAAGVERYDERDDAENQREPTAYGEQYLLNWI
jgi:membrane protein implicated in regulation of membrane protease activity